ncbi:ABC-type phosphate transport system, substrate-binding protein [Saccharopolyspora antimicrobica]|uniref:ABC-type phosphate transport system, substrate-binding protein n=1 Tax=Saccharopolyspora antimicrobica TaxID=455193 RepID=A0A1I5K1H9_9PSEU|nr:substrate-binding domain-containing protein [Saccharopolyspora antimicrobica]RKT84747.1 phosphate ABC transporter substrate-binding protein (PhoT family) [Saccharopolyspora antimicrobica]SFO78892.1 ABC-type phosphate transport system, substrate-binding protein [Saccharopolyspora antimicrobica]
MLVPIFLGLYEFAIAGRKRLGYRIQMDTIGGSGTSPSSQDAGALERLVHGKNAEPLKAPSFMLLRVENYGTTNITPEDYAVPNNDLVGIRVKFPGRRVAGMVITELSDESLAPNFTRRNGLRMTDDVIELPRVSLNPYQHYKVLAVLDRLPETLNSPELIKEPEVIGGIKGGVARRLFRKGLLGSGTKDVGTFGVIKETRSERLSTRLVVVLSTFLVSIILVQYVVSQYRSNAPLGCATGHLEIVGSTAFTPALAEAEQLYEKTCPGSAIDIRTTGSGAGLSVLDDAGNRLNAAKFAAGDGDFTSPEMIAFTDGPKSAAYPLLLPRPVAFSLFTVVANPEAAVQDLSAAQIRGIYAGQYTEWGQLGGKEGLPIRLVSRDSNSGTRKTFETHVLDADPSDDVPGREPRITSDDCLVFDPGVVPARCERDSTSALLEKVASTPGALGYAEAKATESLDEVVRLRIGGQSATLEGADQGTYPFWETVYGYTYSEPEPGSLAASFLRYLTRDVGMDVIESHGHLPCAQLENPMSCQPELPTGRQAVAGPGSR